MQPFDNLTREDRARLAVHLRRFTAAIEHQRRFDRDVMSSITRSLRDPIIRKQLKQLLSERIPDVVRGDSSRRQNNVA
jgi:hypothetical protein